MNIVLDPADVTPLYRQLADVLRDLIARGTLAAGAPLPTRKVLADSLDIDPNTVGRAYQVLKGEGLLESRPRTGTRVSAAEPRINGVRQARLQLLTARMIGEGLAHGYTLAELEAAFIEQRERWQEERRLRATGGKRLPAHVLGIGSQDAALDVLLAELRSAHSATSFAFAAAGSLRD